MSAVQEVLSTVVVKSGTVEYQIATTQQSLVVVNSPSSNPVVSSNISTVVAEIPTPSTVTAAYTAPNLSEDDMAYSKRVDFITDNELYKGEASVGSSESLPVWRLRKITIAALDGDISERWASGSSAFDKVWDNRVSYTYQ